MFYVYVLRSIYNNRHYTGTTKNIAARLSQHNAGKTPSTKAYRPWELVHRETFETLKAARQRELQIKSWKNPSYLEKTLMTHH